MSEPASEAPKPAEETAKSPAETPKPEECASMCHKHKCFRKAPKTHKAPKPASEGTLEEDSPEDEEEEVEKIVVAIPIFKNVTALDFVGPYEVLHLLPNVKVVFVSHSRDLYAADLGMLSFHSTATFDEVPSPDIIVVPGGGGTHDLLTDAPLLDWIRKVNALITELIFKEKMHFRIEQAQKLVNWDLLVCFLGNVRQTRRACSQPQCARDHCC